MDFFIALLATVSSLYLYDIFFKSGECCRKSCRYHPRRLKRHVRLHKNPQATTTLTAAILDLLRSLAKHEENLETSHSLLHVPEAIREPVESDHDIYAKAPPSSKREASQTINRKESSDIGDKTAFANNSGRSLSQPSATDAAENRAEIDYENQINTLNASIPDDSLNIESSEDNYTGDGKPLLDNAPTGSTPQTRQDREGNMEHAAKLTEGLKQLQQKQLWHNGIPKTPNQDRICSPVPAVQNDNLSTPQTAKIFYTTVNNVPDSAEPHATKQPEFASIVHQPPPPLQYVTSPQSYSLHSGPLNSSVKAIVVEGLSPNERKNGNLYVALRKDSYHTIQVDENCKERVMFKVGWVEGADASKRKKSLKPGCSCKYEWEVVWSSNKIPATDEMVPFANRVEKLIHAEYRERDERYDYHCPPPCEHKHTEFMYSTWADVIQCAEYWVNWIKKYKPYLPDAFALELMYKKFSELKDLDRPESPEARPFCTNSQGRVWSTHAITPLPSRNPSPQGSASSLSTVSHAQKTGRQEEHDEEDVSPDHTPSKNPRSRPPLKVIHTPPSSPPSSYPPPPPPPPAN